MAKQSDTAAEKAKAERLAAALRENLKRRKAQARSRAVGSVDNADKRTPPDQAPPHKP